MPEGSGENLFVVTTNPQTAPLGNSVLPGIPRFSSTNRRDLNIKVIERQIPANFYLTDSIFTGTAAEITLSARNKSA